MPAREAERPQPGAEAWDAPWYRAGLHFACARCGRCCSGGGVVEVSDAEIARLALCLGLTDDAFRARYTRSLRKGRVALAEAGHGDCAFLCDLPSGRGCRVHAARPDPCRSYPFWPSILHTREHWREEAGRCPGIGGGVWHDPAEIAETLAGITQDL